MWINFFQNSQAEIPPGLQNGEKRAIMGVRGKNDMKVTLCIPLYNEEAILAETIDTVSAYMTAAFPDHFEVIFIDDGSTDNSKAILEERCSGPVRYLSYQPNRGKGCAVRQGMLAGEGDYIIFTDCDLAYGLDVIPEMVALFDEHPEYDAVVGSRVKQPFEALLSPFSERERHRAVGVPPLYFAHDSAHQLVGVIAVLAALQNKGAKSQFITVIAAEKNLLLR